MDTICRWMSLAASDDPSLAVQPMKMLSSDRRNFRASRWMFPSALPAETATFRAIAVASHNSDEVNISS